MFERSYFRQGKGGKRTKFPWVKVGAERTVKRQSSGEPRTRDLETGCQWKQHSTPDSHLALTNLHEMPADKGIALLCWHP